MTLIHNAVAIAVAISVLKILARKRYELSFDLLKQLSLSFVYCYLVLMCTYILLNKTLFNVALFFSCIFYTELDSKASNLSSLSQKYRQDAKYLNLRSRNAKIAAVVTLVVVFLVYLRYWWF